MDIEANRAGQDQGGKVVFYKANPPPGPPPAQVVVVNGNQVNLANLASTIMSKKHFQEVYHQVCMCFS